MRRSYEIGWLALLLVLLAGCFNPVHSDAVDALGGEAGGERPGPRHRAGQPCLTCHGGDGPGPDFAVAGTVYAVRGQPEPAVGAVVRLTGADGTVRELQTNQVGNFYLRGSSYSPKYPLDVEVDYDGKTTKMKSRLNGTTGCANCHRGAGDSGHAPAVYGSLP